MSLVVVSVIVGLAMHLALHPTIARPADRPPRDGRSRARPTFVPRPRLVLLLPLLPAADLQVAGVGDPRHGRDPDDLPDHPARRCRSSTRAWSGGSRAGRSRWSQRALTVVSMGVLTYKGADRAGGDRERGQGGDPELGAEAGLRRATRKRSPARISFAESGCTNCHTYLGTGSLEPRRAGLSPRQRREGQGASSSRSTTSSARAASTQARRCRRSPPSAKTTCTSSPSSSRPPRARE